MIRTYSHKWERVYIYMGHLVDLYFCKGTVTTWGIKIDGEYVSKTSSVHDAYKAAKEHIDYAWLEFMACN